MTDDIRIANLRKRKTGSFAVHLTADDGGPLCNQLGGVHTKPQVTMERDSVTCERCLRWNFKRRRPR